MKLSMLLICTCVLAPLAFVGTSVTQGTGKLHIVNSVGTTTLPLTVKGKLAQDTLMMVVEISTGTDKFTVSKTGAVTALGTLTAGGDIDASSSLSGSSITVAGVLDSDSMTGVKMTITSDSKTRIPMEVTAHGSQSGNLLECKSNTGANKLYLTAAGKLFVDDLDVAAMVFSGTATIGSAITADSFTATSLTVVSDDPTKVPLTLEAFSTSQSAEMLILEDSNENCEFRVENDGDVYAASSITASSFSGTIEWGDITGTPTTRSGYGIADMGSSTQGTASASCLQSVPGWNSINSKPNTRSTMSLDDEVGSSTQGSDADWLWNNCLRSQTVTYNSFRGRLLTYGDGSASDGGHVYYNNHYMDSISNW